MTNLSDNIYIAKPSWQDFENFNVLANKAVNCHMQLDRSGGLYLTPQRGAMAKFFASIAGRICRIIGAHEFSTNHRYLDKDRQALATAEFLRLLLLSENSSISPRRQDSLIQIASSQTNAPSDKVKCFFIPAHWVGSNLSGTLKESGHNDILPMKFNRAPGKGIKTVQKVNDQYVQKFLINLNVNPSGDALVMDTLAQLGVNVDKIKGASERECFSAVYNSCLVDLSCGLHLTCNDDKSFLENLGKYQTLLVSMVETPGLAARILKYYSRIRVCFDDMKNACSLDRRQLSGAQEMYAEGAQEMYAEMYAKSAVVLCCEHNEFMQEINRQKGLDGSKDTSLLLLGLAARTAFSVFYERNPEGDSEAIDYFIASLDIYPGKDSKDMGTHIKQLKTRAKVADLDSKILKNYREKSGLLTDEALLDTSIFSELYPFGTTYLSNRRKTTEPNKFANVEIGTKHMIDGVNVYMEAYIRSYTHP